MKINTRADRDLVYVKVSFICYKSLPIDHKINIILIFHRQVFVTSSIAMAAIDPHFPLVCC